MTTIFVYTCFIIGLIYIIKIFVKSIRTIVELIVNGKSKQKYIQKSIKFETALAKTIEELAKESERSFSRQVKFMLKKYLETIETE